MKYIIATILSFVVLFLFAAFTALVGWQHGGGYLIKISMWVIIAVLWGAIVKNWDVIITRMYKGKVSVGGPSILDENARFTIIAGLIIIVGAGLFFTLKSPRNPPGVSAVELIKRLNKREEPIPNSKVLMRGPNGKLYAISWELVPKAKEEGGLLASDSDLDEFRLYNYLISNPDLRIYNSRENKWVGNDD